MMKPKGARLLLLLLLLELVHFLSRWILVRSPFFSQVDYDQAIPGLMALHILRGDPQLMLWGQPRMGGLQAYVVGFIFHLFGPSTLSLRLSLLVVSGVMMLIVFAIGKKIGGQRVGILAAAYWALPPIFVPFNGIYAGGGHQEAVLLGSFLLLGAIGLSVRPPHQQLLLAGLLGLLSGVGGWSSLLIMPFVAAAVIGLLGIRPRLLWSPLPLVGLAGFGIGSLPFWAWNYSHDFDTLIHLGGKSVGPVFRHIGIVLSVGLQTLVGTFWDAQSVSPGIPRLIIWGVGGGIYLPVLILASFVVFLWLKRVIGRKPPSNEARDFIVLLLLTFLLIRATGETEDIGLTRYHLVWFVSFTLLTAWLLHWLFALHEVVGATACILLLGFNLYTGILYLQKQRHGPIRPVDHLIRVFQKEGIRYAYGHNRVTQVLTFESQERIIAADFFGTRNYAYLKAVDEAPLQQLAFVTHRTLGNPYPQTLEAALRLLGFGFQKKEIGEYVIFFGLRPPLVQRQTIPAEAWEVKGMGRGDTPQGIKDRDLLTVWKLNRRGDGIEIDLGRERWMGGVTLFPAIGEWHLPSRFRVECSTTGKDWKVWAEVNDYLPGLVNHQGRPRLEPLPVIQVFPPPQPARYLRIINLSEEASDSSPWEISEIFVYEVSTNPSPLEEKTRLRLDEARSLLDRWQEDPTGPHPSIPRLSMDFRKKKVDWTAVIGKVGLAMQSAPDEEEPYLLFGRALIWGELASTPLPATKKTRGSATRTIEEEGIAFSPHKTWTATASHNGSEALLALDGNPSTRWSSGRGQEPEMFFQVDWGEKRMVSGFSLFLGSSLLDYPRGVKVLISEDGQNWRTSAHRSFPHYAVLQGRLVKSLEIHFPPVAGRYLRLVQTGRDPESWWSIYEFNLAGGGDVAAADRGRLR